MTVYPRENKYLIDITQNSLLHRLVLHDLAQHTTITTPDDQHLLGVGVGVHRQMGDHLLVGELVALGALDNAVEDQHGAVVAALEDEDVLVVGFLVVQDLVHLEVHGLAGPHGRLFGEPAICAGLSVWGSSSMVCMV